MTRQLLTILLSITATSAFGQTVFLNTRLHPSEYLTLDQTTLQLDLQDFFQTYSSPGPVATLTIRKPVSEGWKVFLIDGNEVELMSYKLASGGSYDDPYTVSASEFEWTEHTVEYQLLGTEAPLTVANFKTYADDGVYTNTIVHRNESTGRRFGAGGGAEIFTPLPIIQSGGFRLYNTADYLFEIIPTRPAITFEQTRDNTKGTISMARGDSLDSATSQFFLNLEDNTTGFSFRDGTPAYTVFGEILDSENDQPVLDSFANTDIFDLKSPKPWDTTRNTNIFPTLPFTAFPLYVIPELPISYLDLGYAHGFWNKASYVRFTSITVADGDPSGVSYSYEFLDTDGVEGVSDEEAANRASFDIQINGSAITIKRVDSGATAIEVTGTNGSGETASFQVQLVAYNPDALDRFPTATIKQGGILESDWYGSMYADTYPWITHVNHGLQYVAVYEASTGAEVPMYYDYNLESYLYTSSSIYPIIYVYSLGKWVQYVEETGNGSDQVRWFYVYDGDNSGFFNESEL